jgi:hypothetical protein
VYQPEIYPKVYSPNNIPVSMECMSLIIVHTLRLSSRDIHTTMTARKMTSISEYNDVRACIELT